MHRRTISRLVVVAVFASAASAAASQPVSAAVTRCGPFRATSEYSKNNYGGGACAGSKFSMRIYFKCIGKNGIPKEVNGAWKYVSAPSGSDSISCNGSIQNLIIYTNDPDQPFFQFY
jgi:hypothetical protein